MSERETAETIEESAIAWVARLDREQSDPASEAELAAWLAGDERRRGAYLRVRATWTRLDRLGVLGAGGAEVAANDEQPIVMPSRRGVLAWGGYAAAGLLTVGALGLGASRYLGGERIETALGEIRRVPLRDGSVAAVNTDTKLVVNLGSDLRAISLDRGEAWFQVAHDKARPFVVSAGDIRVRAVGTAFSVRSRGDGADVLVTEGIVETWSTKDPSNRRRIVAGDRTFVRDAGGPQMPVAASAQIDRALSWRAGQLMFEGETLGEAVDEFNRYNEVKVRIADDSLRQEKLIGRFHTDDVDGFTRAAATTLGLNRHQDGDVIVLSAG